MDYPNILIFGQPFNDFSGGGITLTNLFKQWPKDKIAVTFIGHGLLNVTIDICDTYYQLGEEEHKWVFPFNLIQRKFPSGLKSFDSKDRLKSAKNIRTGLRFKIVNSFFYPFLRWIGLFHALSHIYLSDRLTSWLKEFKPDILYIQASTRETILFARDLNDFLKIPSVIHVMDDWPSTISNRGLLKNYWNKKINREYRDLLGKATLHLSISEAMSEEYMKRYNKIFIPFHNPIETDRWLKHSKTVFSINPDHVTILYSGRVGDYGIADSLLEVASAIDSMNTEFSVRLHIQAPAHAKNSLDRLLKFKCVVINPFVEYEKIPEVFSQADMLILANDFTKQGVNYLRYSMPTKASEYMISGTPIIVYASEKTAISKFFRTNECGFCVTHQNREEIIKAFEFLINNEEYRKNISRNAVNLAKEKFDAEKVRKEFQFLIARLNVKETANNNLESPDLVSYQ